MMCKESLHRYHPFTISLRVVMSEMMWSEWVEARADSVPLPYVTAQVCSGCSLSPYVCRSYVVRL